MHADDMGLVREFAVNGSDAAFATLVERHINLVYSVALRRLGNPCEAEEVAQVVFIILAKKAGSLRPGTILSGWLYQAAQLTAANAQRSNIRRQHREQEAFMQFTQESESQSWPQLSPFLEDAMSRLRQKDRDAIVLRYFENRTVAEVAQALGLGEAAAQKRLNRATDKLKNFFSSRGVQVSTHGMLHSIGNHAVQIAPAGLASSIATVAAAKGVAAGSSTLTLLKGVLKIMAWTKAKTVVAAAVAAAVAIGATTTGTVMVTQKHHADEVENYFANWDKINIDDAQLPEVVLLRPTKYRNQGSWILSSPNLLDGRLMRRNASFQDVLESAYGVGPEQMVLPPNLPHGQFDMLLAVPKNSRELLREEIKKQYGITGHMETRDTDVLVLKVVDAHPPGLRVSTGGGPNISESDGEIKLVGYRTSDPSGYDISHLIGSYYNKPVMDETGLTNAYDVDVKWPTGLRGAALQKEVERILREQFGLAITPDDRPLQMLVVDRAH
jgi:uncharacterized protein (TIGR03435 family)